MNIDYTVGEVELSYKPKFKNIYKVVSSEDAYKYLLPTYNKVKGTQFLSWVFLSYSLSLLVNVPLVINELANPAQN